MKILFCTSNLPGAVVIRGVTWSEWSHVAIVDMDKVIEASWPKVRISSLQDVLKAHKKWKIVEIPCENEEAALAAAYSQVGKPYDLLGAIGLGFHRDWEDTDKWWCSEIVPWALKQGNTILFRDETLNRITPQHLWMLPYKIIAESDSNARKRL